MFHKPHHFHLNVPPTSHLYRLCSHKDGTSIVASAMGAPKLSSSTPMNISEIANALPSPHVRFRRSREKKPGAPMPNSLPACFSEVWRRRQSDLPAHRRERATLEAVASTLPEDTAHLTGAPAAAVYLAALVVALDRLIHTTSPASQQELLENAPAQKLSKKERKKLKKKERDAEAAVDKVPVSNVLAGGKHSSRDVSMNSKTDISAEVEQEEAGGDDDVELIASLLYLIGLTVTQCSQGVLNAKGEQILDVTMRAMDHVSGHSLVARHTSTLFATVLAVMSASSWSRTTIQRAFLYLLRQTSDGDGKSRRKARESLHSLYHCSRADIIRAKTSTAASAHFVSDLKMHSGMLDAVHDDTVIDARADPNTLVHLLTSIERFSLFLHPPDAAKVAKELVVITVKDVVEVCSFSLLALWSIFKHKVPDESNSDPNQLCAFLPQSDLGKLLLAVLRHELPEDCPNEPKIAYFSCIADGSLAYSSFCTLSSPPNQYILQPVEKLVSAMDHSRGRSDVTKAVARNLRVLLSQRWFVRKPAILKTLEVFASNHYRLVWPDTTPILRLYLEQQMTAGNFLMEGPVNHLAKSLIDARQAAIKGNDRKAQEMTAVLISALVQGGGANRLLNVCGVKYDAKLHVTNAWVLPVLSNHLCGAPLSLFYSSLVPVAEKLAEAIVAMEKEKRVVESKNLKIYFSQVWGLLPGFCTKPSDLAQNGVISNAFKGIHFCLTAKDWMAMYPIGVRALRQLSSSILKLSSEDPTMVERQASFGSRFKKLFPTIIEVCQRVANEKRGNILEAVTLACRATADPSIVSSLMKKVVRNLLELQLEVSNHKRATHDMVDEDMAPYMLKTFAVADLALSITESTVLSIGSEEIGYLKKSMSPFFMYSKESVLQKKAYRLTTLIVSMGFMEHNRDGFFSFVTDTISASNKVAPGAKAVRQGLITAMVNQHMKLESSDEKVKYLELLNEGFLSEVILGTRDCSEKARAASFETLLAMARGWNVSIPGNSMDGLQRFTLAVAAGLGGKTVPMLAATLTSLGRLIYEFRGEASMNENFAAVVDSLFSTIVEKESSGMDISSSEQSEQKVVQPGPVAILLRHAAAEIQKSALGVVKIATKALAEPLIRLINVLPGILPGIVHVAARSKKQETRLRVRVILERLLRKCGRELLEANFPPEHLKLLSAVRKKFSRDLVKKHAAKDRRKVMQQARTEEERSRMDTHENIGSENEFGLDDSDSDIENELLDGDDLLSLQVMAGSDKPAKTKKKEEDVVNLLDKKNGLSVISRPGMKSASQQARKERKSKQSDRKDNVIKYTDDGKPIFVESDEESRDVELGSMNGSEDDSDEDGVVSRKKRSGTATTGKRQRMDLPGGERSAKKVKGSFGEEYRGKRGSGDVKRAGRPDPYAYVPLGMNMLGPGARPGTIGAKRNREGSSLQALAARKGKRKGRSGVPGKR